MEDDDEIRCAILTGDEQGGAFSAGTNLKDPQTPSLSLVAISSKASLNTGTCPLIFSPTFPSH